MSCPRTLCLLFFFFNDTATTEIYTLSLHDALPIYVQSLTSDRAISNWRNGRQLSVSHDDLVTTTSDFSRPHRSEEHTSELQSLAYLVCRLLLEKKNKEERDCPDEAEYRHDAIHYTP